MSETVDTSAEKQEQYLLLRSLPYVPKNEVGATYEILLNYIDIHFFGPFLDYLEINYIGTRDRHGIRIDNGLFKRETWNVYDRVITGWFFKLNPIFLNPYF